MNRAFCSAAQFASRCLCGLASALLLSLILIAARPGPVLADDVDAAGLAVDIFIEGTSKSGLPITKDEGVLVKEIVTCGVARTPIGECVRNAAVQTVLKATGAPPEVKDAVDCIFKGRSVAACSAEGLVKNLPPEAQPMVNCMISGQGDIADCTKKLAVGMVIDKVPVEIQPAASCIIESGDAKKCATDLIVSQVVKNLPADAQADARKIADCLGTNQPASCVASAAVPDNSPAKPLVTCMTAPGANAGQCAATFASNNLPNGTPDAAKAVVACIGAGADFANCAKNPVITGAQNAVASQLSPEQQANIQKALDTIDRLKPDAPPAMDAGISSGNLATLKNILGVAEGIRDKDWGKVVISAGPELAIIASNIILDIFISPPLASVLAPVVEAMIHNDVDAAIRAFNAIGAGNPVGLAQVLFEWYETSFIQAPCALLGNNDVRDTICGGLSDAIKFISTTGGKLAKDLLGAGKDILKWLGLWGTVDDTATSIWNTTKGFIEDVGHVFGIGDDDEPQWKPPTDCATFSPASYMVDHYAACLTKAVDAAASNSQDTGPMYDACVGALSRCIAPNNRGGVAQACAAMGTSLTDMARQTAAAMKVAADTYTGFGGPAAYVNKLFEDATKEKFGPASPDFCSPNFWDAGQKQAYANGCQKFVEARFPQPGRLKPQACPLVTKTSAARGACLASLDASLAASAAKGETWGGPNSDYCKKQQEWVAAHPCEVLKTGKSIPIPGGGSIDDIKIKCTEPRITPPFKEGSGVSMLPPKRALPSSGLTGKPKSPALGGLGPKIHKPPGLGHGPVVNLPRGGNGLMDSLDGLASTRGLDSVSGNNGGGGSTVGPKRRVPCATCTAHGGPVIVKPPANGGSGGYNTSKPIPSQPKSSSSGGSGGYNTSKPIPNSPKSAPSPSVDDRIDYGGCSSCNKDDTLHVH